MTKLPSSLPWFQPVLMAIFTTMFVVDVVSFRPFASVGRIGFASLVHRNKDINDLPESNSDYISLSHFPLKSSNDDNSQDIVLVQNNHTANDDHDDGKNDRGENDNDIKVDELLALLDSVPSNLPTPKSLTDEILGAVKKLEEECPTSDGSVLSELSGNWELLWTAQDKSNEQYINGGLMNRIINPLENQSYSNNPFRRDNGDGATGRANPILPREIQDVLERTGFLEKSGGTKTVPIRSSQGIDLKRKRVRNVVVVQIKKPLSVKGSLIVDVNFKPNVEDKRKIDVKFDSCRLISENPKVDKKFPLGVFGPTGWLRTGYIDDRIRITRGHKGSVFILSRTAKRRSE